MEDQDSSGRREGKRTRSREETELWKYGAWGQNAELSSEASFFIYPSEKQN